MAAKQFSLAAMCCAKIAGTWDSITSTERTIINTLHERHGIPDLGGDLIPGYALASRSTPLTTLAPAAAGYLIDSTLGDYWPALQAASVTLRLGATPVLLAKGGSSIPTGVNGVQTFWAPDETTPLAAGPPSFGQLPVTRHNLFAYCEVTRQLLLQSHADEVLRLEITRAVGAEIDKQILGGSASAGQPRGIVNFAGIGTIAGSNLNYAALIAAETDLGVANAILDSNRLGWAATPAVAALLAQRYRVSTGELPLWQGPLAAGMVNQAPAFSSMNVPANTLIFGDWSELLIAQWIDGLTIEIDPFSKFAQGILGVRACISIDVQLRTPAAFVIASGVS